MKNAINLKKEKIGKGGNLIKNKNVVFEALKIYEEKIGLYVPDEVKIKIAPQMLGEFGSFYGITTKTIYITPPEDGKMNTNFFVLLGHEIVHSWQLKDVVDEKGNLKYDCLKGHLIKVNDMGLELDEKETSDIDFEKPCPIEVFDILAWHTINSDIHDRLYNAIDLITNCDEFIVSPDIGAKLEAQSIAAEYAILKILSKGKWKVPINELYIDAPFFGGMTLEKVLEKYVPSSTWYNLARRFIWEKIEKELF